jgi:hypothetical protein
MNRANELNELLDFTWKTEGQKWHNFLFKTRKIVFNMQLEHEIWALTFHTTEDLAVTEERRATGRGNSSEGRPQVKNEHNRASVHTGTEALWLSMHEGANW